LEVDGCSFVSCYTEGDGVRAFTGASFFNYTDTGGLTVAQCANDCAGFLYFGVEYGGEVNPFPPFNVIC
jgi:hypothetical protein